MTIIKVLEKIQNKEIKEGTVLCITGALFYNMIVIDGSLYFINSMAKDFMLVNSECIAKMWINKNKIYEYKAVME